MAKIAEIVSQNPWWKHEDEFDRFDQSLQKAKPIFFQRTIPNYRCLAPWLVFMQKMLSTI